MTLHKTTAYISAISFPLLLAKLLNQLKTIYRRESSITSSEVPENLIIIENPSDNFAFKENAQHVHTNIDTFKRKPEKDNLLHFSKIAMIEAKFDALKIHLTCEISIQQTN